MFIFSGILAIIIAIVMTLSLGVFPNFYLKTAKYGYLRVGLIIGLLVTEANQFGDNLHDGGGQYFSNYFTLYSCTISAGIAIIMLIFPKKIFLECFFPLGVMGPILTLIFPSKQPTILEGTYYVFFFGHIFTLFGFMYIYLYSFTEYKFSKRSIQSAIITGLLVLTSVELFNLYFGVNYIVGDIGGALGAKYLPRPLQFLVSFVSGLGIILIGLSITYFFKPIYEYKTNVKLRSTGWEVLLVKIKKSKNLKSEISETK